MDKSSITAREWHVRKALPEDLPMIAEIEKLLFTDHGVSIVLSLSIIVKLVIFMYGETEIVLVDI